jgi:endonuclease YncB( thermonuclease family)
MRALCAVLCCIALGAQAETFTARVVAVLDGDTVLILREGGSEAAGRPPASPLRGLHHDKPAKLRLANIDAPEKTQAYGKQSRESLLEMVGKKQVQIEIQAVDQYGRIVGVISVDGRNVNQEQVRLGMAWEYSYHHSDKTYIGLQSEARQAGRGLWGQPSPLAPWQWRKLHSSATPVVPNRTAAPVMLYDMECGKKRYCSQMASCDEAHFYLTRCGVKTLDGNGDGEPCENLCAGRN